MPGHVYCEDCMLQFYGWKPDEDPYTKHQQYSPTCAWILANPPANELEITLEAQQYQHFLAQQAAHLEEERQLAKEARKRHEQAAPITPPATFSTTFSKPIAAIAVIVAKAATPSKPSRPPRSVIMSPTFSQTPVISSVNHVTKKPYMTIDDLYAMFAGK